MKKPETSSLFEKRINEKSNVEYYVLTKKVATYQQGFYFVNNSMTNDGRYLWFYASYPPVFYASLRQLGVIDFKTDEIHVFHDTLFEEASPYIDPETGNAFFTWKNRIFMRSPRKNDHTVEVAEFPTHVPLTHLSTHLTPTPDKKEFFLDMREGNNCFYVGTINMENGKFTKWANSDFYMNHAQLNPCNPNIALCAYDAYKDMITGERISIPTDEKGVYQRLWTVTREGVKTNYAPNNNYATHEWWSHDGKKIYYVNDYGIQQLNLETGEHVNLHKTRPWHAHSSNDDSFFVYDQMIFEKYDKWYRGCPAKVVFYNALSDREIDIVSYMPSNGFTPENPCDYHIDPHPRITDNQEYVVFTTSELGGADLAVASIQSLLNKTRK